MVAPTLMLWLYAVAFGITSAAAPDGAELPRRADSLSRFALAYILGVWVTADARKRNRRLCYDYDSFVFLVTPVAVPVYLFQTRGPRAFLTFLCFAGIWLIGMLVGCVVFLVRGFTLS